MLPAIEGGELNAVMNYPLWLMLIDFVNGQLSAAGLSAS